MKSLILDFIGVVADPDYIKLILDLPLTQKFSALRIFLSLKKFPIIKESFNQYQLGEINARQFEKKVKEVLPNSAYVIPSLLERFPSYISVNEEVISLAYNLRKMGIRTFLMSNAIPETEIVMNKYDLSYAFEGLLLSNHLGLMKPNEEIYRFAIETSSSSHRLFTME